MKFDRKLCEYLLTMNPGAEIKECQEITGTTTTAKNLALTDDRPITAQISPKIITTQFLTQPTTLTPMTQSTQTPKPPTPTPTQSPKTQTQPILPHEDWVAHIFQAIRDSPLWLKFMGGLTMVILLMFMVSCCCKGLSKIITDNNPGNCLGCVDCLEKTAIIANLIGLAFKAFRDSLAAVVNGNGQLPRQQHETRDTDFLLPGVPGGPLNSRQDGQILLAESQF